MSAFPLTVDGENFHRKEIAQHLLDLETRVRTNLFPWRGQFSPGLVDILLTTYASTGEVALDPFAGVGTSLVEAARKGISCFGSEINPAAVAMAQTVMFIGMRLGDRKECLNRARLLVDPIVESSLPLFGANGTKSLLGNLAEVEKNAGLNNYELNIIRNVLIRVADEASPSADSVYRAFREHADIIESLPYSENEYAVENSDARNLSLPDEAVDFVVTSPPYLNVFNYHQNNRPAMELLGWDLLHVAKSEFGANRKHRGNRFLTVIQYCLDMQGMLLELRRVMKPSGRAIFVVGRESCIRGVSFQNGHLVNILGGLCGFSVALKQERKFKNKFGAVIYEDILHFVPTDDHNKEPSDAVNLAVNELKAKLKRDLKPDVAKDLKAAIEGAQDVKASPLYKSDR